MDLDTDFKSPLPPRRSGLEEELPKETENVISDQNQDTIGNIHTQSTTLSSQPIEQKKGLDFKNINKNQLIIFGSIGVVILLILFLIFGVLIPNLNGSKNKPVVLNYWGLWENPNVINGIIADFESKNPGIKINYKQNQKDDYRTRLAGRLSKPITEEDVPDIFRIHNTWIPMFRNNLAKVPVTTTTNLQLDTDFFSVYKQDLTENRSYLAIPLMYDGLGLFYNKDLISAAQVDLPKSWWNLENAANKLTVKDEVGNIKVAGVAMGLSDNIDHWSDILGVMMKQNGVDLLNIDSSTNNQKLQDVLLFYTLFATKDKVWDITLPSSTQLFANGKLAFYFAPSWRVFDIEQINPNLKFEITTIPQLPTLANVPLNQVTSDSDLTNIGWASYWVEGVNSKSPKQKEAWKFLEYLASKEGLEKMYTAQSQTRSFGEIYPRKSMIDQLLSNSRIKPFVSMADNSQSWYVSSNTFDSGVNDEMIKYFGDAINAIALNSKPVNEVTPDLVKGINQLIQKYQLKR